LVIGEVTSLHIFTTTLTMKLIFLSEKIIITWVDHCKKQSLLLKTKERITTIYTRERGVGKLTGEILKVVCAEFSTLS
jgi:hypothetical protein